MKKFLVFCVLALVLVGSAGAQEGSVMAPADTSTGSVPAGTGVSADPSLNQYQDSSGSGQISVGDEVSRLQREMEERIRAIRTEYQAKIAEARKKVQALKQTTRPNARQSRQSQSQRRSNTRSQSQQQQGFGPGIQGLQDIQGFGGQDFQNSVRQNIQQGIQQNIRQNVRENVRQNIESLVGGSGSGFQPQGFQGTTGLQQQNPIGTTQEQFGPSTGSGQVPPPTGGTGGGSVPPPPSGGTSGGSFQPAPFSSSVLEKFLPLVGW